MPTTYMDQFWVIDPFSPPAVGTVLTVEKYEIVDQDDNGFVGGSNDDSINGIDIDRAYPGDTVTVSLPGGGTQTITGITFYLNDGTQVFTPTDGSELEDLPLASTTYVNSTGSLDVNDLGPPCLCAGTHVMTTEGACKVEDLQAGMRILSDDGRELPLRMILSAEFESKDVAANDKLLPVRIVAGSLGNGLPTRDLLVSRQHRMLVDAPVVRRAFNHDAVLVPAIKLTSLPGIYIDHSVSQVTYYHLVFDAHEVITAEGAATESLFIGPQTMSTISEDARNELLLMFPQLKDRTATVQPAKPIPAGRAQRQLVERLQKNGHFPLQSAA